MKERFIIQEKTIMGKYWEDVMPYSTLEQAKTALPYFRKDTTKPLRIMRQLYEIVHEDFATSPKQEKE